MCVSLQQPEFVDPLAALLSYGDQPNLRPKPKVTPAPKPKVTPAPKPKVIPTTKPKSKVMFASEDEDDDLDSIFKPKATTLTSPVTVVKPKPLQNHVSISSNAVYCVLGEQNYIFILIKQISIIDTLLCF